MEHDVRWKQRLENYTEALNQLRFADTQINNPNNLEKDGTIQRFEFTHELAWKLMKDYLEYEGITGIAGSRSAIKEAFNKGLIMQGQIWMDMIETRNTTVHTYPKDILNKEYHSIKFRYFPLLEDFCNKMKQML